MRAQGYENSFGTPPCLGSPGARLFLGGVSALKELFFATWPEGLLFEKEIWTRVKSQTEKKWPIRLLGRVPAKEAGSAFQCSAQAGMQFLAHGPLVWWDAGSQFTDHAPLLMEKP